MTTRPALSDITQGRDAERAEPAIAELRLTKTLVAERRTELIELMLG